MTPYSETAFWSSWSKSVMERNPCTDALAVLMAEVRGAWAALWHPSRDPVIQRSSVLSLASDTHTQTNHTCVAFVSLTRYSLGSTDHTACEWRTAFCKYIWIIRGDMNNDSGSLPTTKKETRVKLLTSDLVTPFHVCQFDFCSEMSSVWTPNGFKRRAYICRCSYKRVFLLVYRILICLVPNLVFFVLLSGNTQNFRHESTFSLQLVK